MTINGWIKILIFCTITLLPVKPLGACMTGVGSGGRTALSPLLRPVARSLSRASGISGNEVRHWSSCAVALLIAMLRLQDALAHNPG